MLHGNRNINKEVKKRKCRTSASSGHLIPVEQKERQTSVDKWILEALDCLANH